MPPVAAAWLLLLAATPAAAQAERIVAAIRSQYEEVGQLIRQSEARKPDDGYGVGIVRNELIINKDGEPWRAIGIYRVVYTFWFQALADPDRGYPRLLRKATVDTRISSRQYYQEFFYDPAGALAFYFRRAEEGDRPVEVRFYFDKGRAVRVVVDRDARDTLAPDETAMAQQAAAKGNEVRRLFKLSLKAPVE